jgi:ribosomal-protein-serine acetyltransferase
MRQLESTDFPTYHAVPRSTGSLTPRAASLELSDGNVRLRPYRGDDIDALYEAARESVAEINVWLPWCHPDYTRDDAIAWVDSRSEAWRGGREYSFVIEDPSDGSFAGGCGLNQIDELRLRANLGYWLRTSRTGRGLATAATRLLARWGLTALGLQRIEIVAAVGNVRSQRVAERAGAVREGIARCRLRVHDVPHDAVCYSLIKSDIA